MKVSSASIRLILRTSKVLSDGSHPIYLRCSFNGMKEVSTGCSCTVRYWNKKDECIKKGYPNYASINEIISKMKNDAISRRNQFEIEGKPYTPSMVLQQKVSLSATSGDIEALINRYTANLSKGTCKVWKSFFNGFTDFAGKVSIVEIDTDMVKRYASWLEGKGLQDSTIRMTLSKLSALCKYAVEEGIIKESPFKRFNYLKRYKTTAKLLYIDKSAMEVLKEMLLEQLVIVKSNGNYKYIDDGLNDFTDRTSKLFVLAFYLFGYIFQGLAPIDLCQLLKTDLTITDKHYRWDGKRQKTGVSVKIRVSRETFFNEVIIKTMLMFHNGTYLLPVCDGLENADDFTRYKRVSNWLSNHSDVLKDWFRMANDRIVKMNVDAGSNIPLINLDCTFYSYRNSYAMMYMSKGGSPIALATLMGRSSDTLGAYVTQLSEESDILDSII